MSDMTRGKVSDSVKVEARQLASARKKRHPSRHESKISGGKFSGTCCISKKK